MVQRPYTQADLDALCAWDTPTICNALELVVPQRRGHGFTVRPFTCAHPSMPPICGPARVGTIRAAHPSGRSKEADRAARIGWYEYVANADMPTVVVLQDLEHHLYQQHPQHLGDLVDQQVPAFLVYLEFLANLLVLEDQPFLLRLQVLADQQDLAHQLIQLHQLHPKLF